MPSKQLDMAKSNISPVLFLTVDGEPMSFYLRPGPVKLKLQPLITAGGGLLCKVQQPGTIPLIDPDERDSIPETSAHWYVSTKYIHDCVEKDEQLNLEDYRLNLEVVPRQSARLKNKETSPGLIRGRLAYTAEEDAAILSYVSKYKTEIGGNRLWQEMEKQRVTGHSWQSMKTHYKVLLAKKQEEVVEAATTVEDTKTEGGGETKVEEETDVQKPPSAEDAASPQTHSAATELTQIDDQSIPSESTQPEIGEAQTSISPKEKVQHVSPQTDEQPGESTQVETVEAETSNSPQPERPCLDPQTDSHPILAESAEPETDELISAQKESVPEDSPPTQPEPLPETSSQKKPKAQQKASPKPEKTQRRLTRRQLVLEDPPSPEPYGKKLRSSSTSPGKLSSSPQPSKKTKSAVESALQKDTTVEQPPCKRARGKSVTAVAESQEDRSGQNAVSETAQADTESNSVPQKGEKKKEKRRLGILELASKEFEDESESGEDEAPDLQNPTETATKQLTSTDPPLSTSDTAADTASTQSNPEHGLSLQEKTQETQASSSNCLAKTGGPEPAAIEAFEAISKAHLFIFDSESQEDDSQSILGDNLVAPSKPWPRVDGYATFSLTQVQLEEDKQRIKELMSQTNQDLISVTKALLKTSGDFSAARDQLLNHCSISRPLWNRCDDSLLLSADPVVRQQLQEKYSEEDVVKRIVFLEVDG
ncbi:telomeric repeat-binding factor 2-interacting protein 1 [Etheostoma cragini]|uniref:telomeric repeat-binding factor 2-interacting protein 1 n=1 Tax=Etheostoma cragini TaxID=417921 RepID=UPI00155E263E|nr:telomeric repeat-binding factor 2-interacting protein 1 [Etheostoma cragini]XP_034725393.1 telomeric repeat-binding factor 2-interacting protein 1 [Etheostoma cragini]XP_034725394.1 telomeric repeat-binding factor 2-interacting protein 1 [Etheostoma cragini]